MKVLCVAPDADALRALREASVSAEWELVPGATDETDALATIDAERPHVLVAFGPYEHMIALVRDAFPGMWIVSNTDAPGASEVAGSPAEVRDLIRGLAHPGGPVLT
jgi:hypothetical protein